MGDILPSLAIDEESLNNVQTKVLGAVLQKLGFSSKTPFHCDTDRQTWEVLD
jgi:hypothetical protein